MRGRFIDEPDVYAYHALMVHGRRRHPAMVAGDHLAFLPFWLFDIVE
jgi:hypothetical protein